ncbi:MAG TPA: hypothetical protein PK158_08450 [Spirochaetota bacterium]|nr:hypothetical protein [Spirochaetota bacterium]
MNKIKIPKHIEVELYICPNQIEGSFFGRLEAAPMNGNFRPQFYYEGDDWDCIVFSEEIEQINVGEYSNVFVAFLSPDRHKIKLKDNQVFLLKNGQGVIGYGKIIQIIGL